MRGLTSFVLVFAALSLGSCASVRSLGSARGSYVSYVESHLKVERLYSHGKQLLAVKFLPVTTELKRRQEELAPGYSVQLKPQSRQILVAVSAFGRRTLSPLDLSFLLDGQVSQDMREVSPMSIVESLYPFAYPFYRVFLVNFPAGSAPTGELEVRSPWGRVTGTVEFSEGGGA